MIRDSQIDSPRSSVFLTFFQKKALTNQGSLKVMFATYCQGIFAAAAAGGGVGAAGAGAATAGGSCPVAGL